MKWQVPRGHIIPGKVIAEDADTLTLQIAKREDFTWSVETGDAFHTIVFVRVDPTTREPESWLPWEHNDPTFRGGKVQ